MTIHTHDDAYEPAHTASPTAHALDELQLYGYRPFDEPDPRPMPDGQRLAVAVAGWLLRNGYHVPDDVSVACVDDPALLSYSYPSITTMSFDYRLTGMRAGQLLIDAIEGVQGGLVTEVVMPYTLQSRDSTRALKTEH